MDLNEDSKTQQTNPKRCILGLGMILAICNSMGVLYLGNMQERDLVWKIKMIFFGILFLALVLTSLYTLWEKSCENGAEKQNEKYYSSHSIVIGFSYLLSLGFVIVGNFFSECSFWMIGGLLLAVTFHPYIGSICQIYFAFLHGVVQEQDMEAFAISFLLALGLCFFVPYLKNISSVGYVVMLALAGNGIGIIIENDFNLLKIFSINSLLDEVAMFVIVLLCGGISWVFRLYVRTGKLTLMPSAIKDALGEKEEETLWEPGVFMRIGDMNTTGEKDTLTVQEILQEDFVLQQKLRTKLPEVYLHTKNVAAIGRQAASCIGADSELVYAGGMYHEIGKLKGTDYVKNGIELAGEYDFPEVMIQMIAEHNVTCKLATTREAAVLMLTDSIVSMMERIGINDAGQEEKRRNMVEKVFALRLQKGELDESQLTIGDIKQLREFFCQYATDKQQEEE